MGAALQQTRPPVLKYQERKVLWPSQSFSALSHRNNEAAEELGVPGPNSTFTLGSGPATATWKLLRVLGQ